MGGKRGYLGVKLVLVVLTVILGGCAWQSGAQKIGEDKYQVSANASPMRGGETGARSMALSAANKQCDSADKTHQGQRSRRGGTEDPYAS